MAARKGRQPTAYNVCIDCPGAKQRDTLRDRIGLVRSITGEKSYEVIDRLLRGELKAVKKHMSEVILSLEEEGKR
jgi:hypothetical protein